MDECINIERMPTPFLSGALLMGARLQNYSHIITIIFIISQGAS